MVQTYNVFIFLSSIHVDCYSGGINMYLHQQYVRDLSLCIITSIFSFFNSYSVCGKRKAQYGFVWPFPDAYAIYNLFGYLFTVCTSL